MPQNFVLDLFLFKDFCKSKILQANAWISRSDKVQQLVAVLADERFQVVTSDVVPFHPVIVEVVQDRQARLVITLKNVSLKLNHFIFAANFFLLAFTFILIYVD